MSKRIWAVIGVTAIAAWACSGDSTSPKPSPFVGRWEAETFNGKAFPVVLDSMLRYDGEGWTYTIAYAKDLVVLADGSGLWADTTAYADDGIVENDPGPGPFTMTWTAEDSTLHASIGYSVGDLYGTYNRDFQLRSDGKLETADGATVFRHADTTIQ